MDTIFSERCGARWGQTHIASWNCTWPFAEVFVTHESIRLNVLGGNEFFFTPDDITEIKVVQGFMDQGIRIVHARNDYPPYILFWPNNLKRAKSKLEEFGYSVKE